MQASNLFFAVTTALALAAASLLAEERDGWDPSTYELRVMTAKPGKLPALHDWFRAHQEDILAKHGAESVAYLVPAEGKPEDRLIAILRFPNLAGEMKFQKAAHSDPRWRQANEPDTDPDSLVTKVEVTGLRRLDFSPEFQSPVEPKPEAVESAKQPEPRVFELRTYACPSDAMLARLHDRFRGHTCKLFEKHGMENLVYWRVTDTDDAEKTLIYLLGHKSIDAAKNSFAAFRADPEWLAAKKASEEQAGGSLTNAQNGVLSLFLKPTEYSPLK